MNQHRADQWIRCRISCTQAGQLQASLHENTHEKCCSLILKIEVNGRDMDCNLNHCKFVPMTIEAANRLLIASPYRNL